jgi:protein gp37
MPVAGQIPGCRWRTAYLVGVSVENKKHGYPRIEKLRGAKSKVAFLSIEPLLEDLRK